MGGLSDRTPTEILDAMAEEGTMPSERETAALCTRATEADVLEAKLYALERLLCRIGYRIVDVTTDDDDGTVLELVTMEPTEGNDDG